MDCFVYSGAPFNDFPLSFSIKGIVICSGYAFKNEVEDSYIRGHFSEKYADEHCKRLFNVESKISI